MLLPPDHPYSSPLDRGEVGRGEVGRGVDRRFRNAAHSSIPAGMRNAG